MTDNAKTFKAASFGVGAKKMTAMAVDLNAYFKPRGIDLSQEFGPTRENGGK